MSYPCMYAVNNQCIHPTLHSRNDSANCLHTFLTGQLSCPLTGTQNATYSPLHDNPKSAIRSDSVVSEPATQPVEEVKIEFALPQFDEPLTPEEKQFLIKELEGTKIKDLLLDKSKINHDILASKVTVYEA